MHKALRKIRRIYRQPIMLSVSLSRLSRRMKAAIFLFLDFSLVPLAYCLVSWVEKGVFVDSLPTLLTMTIAGGMASYFLGLPRIKLKSYEQSGIQRTAWYGVIAGITGALSYPVFHGVFADPALFLSVTMALMILSVSARLLMRRVLVAIYSRGNQRQRVLIYGAGQTGTQLAAALDADGLTEPVAFIDDNKSLQNVVLGGRVVYSPVGIKKIIEEEKISRIVLAMPSISRPKQARLAQHLSGFGCEVSILPSFASLVGESPLIDILRPANPASFLGREGVDESLTDRSNIYSDSIVMITGAGGSIGTELARQLLKCKPKTLILFDVSEPALYQIDRELRETPDLISTCHVVPVLGSITDERHIKRLLTNYKVETVLHAAAYKHVPMVELNSLPSLHNNVVGTQIVAKAASEVGVANFILISTDKAVHPTSIMGASKRFAELLVQDLASRSATTCYSLVRFGNVLGSSGSVVPLFSEQIARGGPVTLTHNEVTRYFMTIAEAAYLVLIVGSQARKGSRKGQIFLLDMGQPVQIRDLAERMIEDAGYTVCDARNPTGDIEIIVQGLRQGEKLHEQLAIEGEEIFPTDHPKISSVNESKMSELEVASALRTLTEALEKGDEKLAIQLLERWLGTPTHPIALTSRRAITAVTS